jgi:hypothetical protein
MKLNNLLDDLKNQATQNETLDLLHAFTQQDPQIKLCLLDLISQANTIDNTHSFASILQTYPSQDYIAPLISEISKAIPLRSPWLADYMLVLIDCLSEREEILAVDDAFVHALGVLLETTDGGELSWKAGDILALVDNFETYAYLQSGALNTQLFTLTRIACLRGFINSYHEQHLSETIALLEKLQLDDDGEVRLEAIDVYDWLTGQE